MRPNHLISSLNFGTIAGLSLFAAFLLFYYIGLYPLGGISWLAALISVFFIVKGIKSYRENVGEGFITYGKAFSTGFFICYIYASMFAILLYLFGTYVDGHILQMYLDDSYQGMELAKNYLSESMYEDAVKQLDNTTMGMLAMQQFFNKVMGGLIIALIAAGFLKKNYLPIDKVPNE